MLLPRLDARAYPLIPPVAGLVMASQVEVIKSFASEPVASSSVGSGRPRED